MLSVRVYVALNMPVSVPDDSDEAVVQAVLSSLFLTANDELLQIVVTDVGGEAIRKEIPNAKIRQAHRFPG